MADPERPGAHRGPAAPLNGGMATSDLKRGFSEYTPHINFKIGPLNTYKNLIYRRWWLFYFKNTTLLVGYP
jgi:hypothetical protein